MTSSKNEKFKIVCFFILFFSFSHEVWADSLSGQVVGYGNLKVSVSKHVFTVNQTTIQEKVIPVCTTQVTIPVVDTRLSGTVEKSHPSVRCIDPENSDRKVWVHVQDGVLIRMAQLHPNQGLIPIKTLEASMSVSYPVNSANYDQIMTRDISQKYILLQLKAHGGKNSGSSTINESYVTILDFEQI